MSSAFFTKSVARNIFFGGSVFFILLFLVLTLDTTRKLPKSDHRENITPEVVRGKHICFCVTKALRGESYLLLCQQKTTANAIGYGDDL